MSSSSCSTSDFCCCSRAEFPLSEISRWWRGAERRCGRAWFSLGWIARWGREKRAVGHERATVAINVTPDTKLVFCDELDQVDVTRGGSDSRVANPAERRRWRGRARQRHHRIGQHLGSRPEKTDPAIDAIHAISFCHVMRHQTSFPLGERIALHSADAPLNEAQCRYERLGTRQRPNSGA